MSDKLNPRAFEATAKQRPGRRRTHLQRSLRRLSRTRSQGQNRRQVGKSL